MPDEPTALYRLYGAGGTLLYVGITNDTKRRFAQHAFLKPWWSDVLRREVEWFSDRESAAHAEVRAIKDHDPVHNGTHSPSRARRINRDDVGPDGVRHISLSRARCQFNEVAEDVMNGTITVLLNYGRPQACLVTPEFYEAAVKALGKQS
ncbi:GIY-YIG nuclease family protein [Streptomyces sp. NPDC086776]|uniref:GIY-YIG nuclease family protein n=1 Tax=Streptomyces sp. NPDC086776 TaxID=3365756 RepID=UPI00381B94F9